MNKSIEIHDDNFEKCFEHFSLRVRERFFKDEKYNFSIGAYYREWIYNKRGEFVKFDDRKRMIRVIGNYHKDETQYKIIYVYNKSIQKFIPLTLYEITDHKKKFHIQNQVLKNKRKLLNED